MIDQRPTGTTNEQLENVASQLNIQGFRGVFMRDKLPSFLLPGQECGILNLDTSLGSGTHWTCWYVSQEGNKFYFDSYGTAIPAELQQYLGKDVLHNDFQIQAFNSDICGDLCLLVLHMLNCGFSYVDIILALI